MQRLINQKAKKLKVPGIRIFANEVVKYDDGINLTIGEPDFNTPGNVKKAGVKAITNDLTGYSHNAGLYRLRESVAQFFKETYSFSYNPETEIIITNGVSEGIDSVLRTILCEGDEVIIPAPIYPAYEPIIQLLGAKITYLDTSDNQFLPDPEKLKDLINDRTKAVIFNFPSNPTGVTLSKQLMDQLVSVLKDKDIFIISDEIYSENTFSGKHYSFASYEGIRDKLILLHGLSKSHSMTGWRVGYVLGSEDIMKHVLKVHLYNAICASVPSQYAAIEALDNSREIPKQMNETYIKRRDYVYKRLSDMGLPSIKPQGAFYIFPSIKKLNMTSMQFAKKLLDLYHVAVVPGSGFTKYGEGHVRISFANSMKNLEEGLDRMEDFIKSYSK